MGGGARSHEPLYVFSLFCGSVAKVGYSGTVVVYNFIIFIIKNHLHGTDVVKYCKEILSPPKFTYNVVFKGT